MRCGSKQLLEAVSFLESGNWKAAHEIVQHDEETALACWAHGIVHIMEGDLPNARYWYRKAGRQFPARPEAKEEISALSSAAGMGRANR